MSNYPANSTPSFYGSSGGGPPNPAGNGQVQVHGGSPPPPRDPFNGLLAPDHIDPVPGSMLQWKGPEEECYSYKALLAMTLKDLPGNATMCRA